MSLNRATPIDPKPDTQQADNFRGILLMALAFFVFSAADTLAKFLTGAFHPVQVAWIRQLGLLSGVVVILAVQGFSVLKTNRLGLQMARGMLAVVSATAFIFALRYVPLADAVAITFVAPFMVTIFSALILGERVGIRRISAVAIGFIGTLIVIRPGLGAFHPAALLILLAALAFSLRQIVSRYLAASDRTSTTVTYTALASILLLTVPLPFFWVTPDSTRDLLLLAGMAICAGVGELLVIRALQIAHASALAPVHYTLIIWGTFYGWAVFGQLPDGWTWLGASIIIATGLYIIHRERQLAKL